MMVDVSALREILAQVAQSTRIVIRCLSSGRDSQESSQTALSLLTDLLDILYRIRDQISWTEEKWIVHPKRLNSLHELLKWFESSMRTIELYFQPGGVGVCYFRKHLLEKSFLPRLEQYKIIFLLAMQPDSRERSTLDRELRSNLSKYHDIDPQSLNLDHQYAEDILSLASRLSSEQYISLADLCNRRQQGTCKWVFESSQYQEWLLGSVRTLYCVGPPGVGKTFLSSAIIDSLQKTFTSSAVATVFIFCQDATRKEQTSTDLLQNILAQLVYRKRSVSSATCSLYHSESLIQGRASAKAYQNAIRAEINRFSKVFFVIDGLDMFYDKERILSRLQKLPAQAQMLVTLREATYTNGSSYLNVLAPPEDIQLYALSRILLDPAFRCLFEQSPEESNLEEEVIRSVVEQSHGLFLLAKLHMDLLTRYTDWNLLERALFHLPESLSEAYGEAMKQVVSSNPSATRRVYWTLYSFRPLTVAELKFATTNFKTEEKRRSVSFEHLLQIESGGLLTVDAVTGTVRFVHNTAREYLSGAAARVFFPNAQKDIAETCLTAITPDEVVDDCYMTDGTASRNKSVGFLSYAAMYWGYHARDVDDEEQTIQVLIKTFLNKLLWRRPPVKELSTEQCTLPSELGLGKYPNDWSALHILAFFGIMGKTRRLLEHWASIHANDNSIRITPLHCAAYRGNDKMVEFMLDNGADGNAAAKDGSTALHVATQHGQRKVMKLLLNRRVNSQMMNGQGATSLQLAVGTAADEATVPLLVKNKVGVNIRNIRTGNTALHLAVEWRRPRIILFLLEKGAGIDLANEEGLTPLQVAATIDNCEAISLLLQRSAQVEARSLSGLTALQLAAHNKHWVAFDLLLIGGANINAWNNEGETLLHEHARKNTNVSIASKLLEHNANIEARTSQGYTPLQCAAMTGNKTMAKFLLSKGARVDVETAKGESLLHITPPANEDCIEILKLFLDHGLGVQAVSSQGWTPLHQTVYMSNGASDHTFDNTIEYIQLLLEHGAGVNTLTATPAAETALHLATMTMVPQKSLITLLIENGANVNAITTEGKTPLHLAAERGREAIFRVLLDCGADLSLEIPNGKANDVEKRPRAGSTAIDLAQKNPLGVLWFDCDGNLRPVPERSRRDSSATIIEEDINPEDFDDGTGESTLVGSEQGYIAV